jgi:hypothetical protein
MNPQREFLNKRTSASPHDVYSPGRFALIALIMSIRPKPSAKNEQGEFGTFTRLLDKLLSVPHSKIKAELEAEKKRNKRPRDRATRRHAYRDVADAD